jgi:hypothetical protein
MWCCLAPEAQPSTHFCSCTTRVLPNLATFSIAASAVVSGARGLNFTYASGPRDLLHGLRLHGGRGPAGIEQARRDPEPFALRSSSFQGNEAECSIVLYRI